MKTLLATGYRAHELGIYNDKHPAIPYIKKAAEARILPLLDEGLEWVITPGQYGFDLWVCEVVLALRADYPELKLGIVTAHAAPEERWKEEKQEEYRRITSAADYCAAVSNRPYEGPWQFRARDELLLRKSDGILLFYDEEAAEGSPKFFRERAMKRYEENGYEMLVITADEVQGIADEESRQRYE
ncbi:DUF1273 domain-containing protein [Paenibacillus spiritus]|uniref:DUF1273 domain-containing protein n=1 Tax=Paenibacillus spiritus TaxID=2496557 RepID=UPI00168B5392|nr:DUF1273 domain-containing protein [Paenibacillus spiritus]